MKRLVFCFDGTWNRLDAQHPTNIVLTAESITPSVLLEDQKITQIIHYDEGVGTQKWEKYTGGLMGHGLLKNLSDAYRFLIFNYTPGDEIYVFGFSRGAYSARSFVGLIRNCGVLKRSEAGRSPEAIKHYQSRKPDDHPDSASMNEFRSKYGQKICVSEQEKGWRSQNIDDYDHDEYPMFKISYLGVWDTVGSLGVPKSLPGADWLNKKHRFHDTSLTGFVEAARHAVAIDEKRNTFSPSLWSNFDELNQDAGHSPEDYDAPYQQKWFPGTHGSVGGGGERRGLSDQAMDWVLDGARARGLVLDSEESSVIFGLQPNYREHIKNYQPPQNFGGDWIVTKFMTSLPKADRMPGPLALHDISESVKRRWHEFAENLKDKELYRPLTLNGLASQLDGCEKIGVCSYQEGTYDIYIVKHGDSLSKIAKAHLDDAEKWPLILEANTHKIDDPDRIYIGMRLVIPKTMDVEND